MTIDRADWYWESAEKLYCETHSIMKKHKKLLFIYYSSGSEFEFFDIINNSAKMYESIDVPFKHFYTENYIYL